jgi:hypothetical protein
VKRYLARVPKQAAILQLQVAQSQESLTLLGEWPVEEVVPEISDEILLLLEEHAETVRASVTAQLIFLTSGGTRVGSQKVLRQSPPSMEGEDDTGTTMWSTPAQLTGESQQQAAQAQRHLEVMTKMVFSAMGMLCTQMKSANEHVLELCETLATRLSESEARSRESVARADEAESYLREVAEQAQSADTQEKSEAPERIIKMFEPMLPVIMAQLMQPAQPRPPVPIPPPTVS